MRCGVLIINRLIRRMIVCGGHPEIIVFVLGSLGGDRLLLLIMQYELLLREKREFIDFLELLREMLKKVVFYLEEEADSVEDGSLLWEG